ncbi:MGMT family protein [Candidatus Woesearchaeota archaeon]|nr:MGMT family protein [Candidatus Woesearchaeota archaeon]
MGFYDEVYKFCRQIPEGKVSTYKELANAMNTKAYRAVGRALRNNPDPVKTPCYKIVRNNGEIGGYSGSNPKNIKKKIEKLKNDGIEVKNNKIINLKEKLYRF